MYQNSNEKKQEIAPYLKIDGKPVMVGQEYWTVHKTTNRLLRHVASCENNTIDRVYFLEEEKALEYYVIHEKVLSISDIMTVTKVRYPELEKALFEMLTEKIVLKNHGIEDSKLFKNIKNLYMKKIGAGIIALLVKVGPKILSVFTKLLKSSKAVKGVLAIGSFAGYAYMFTWQFAALILVSVFIHELGHIYAMKRVGIKTKGVYFIPFLGAAAVADGTFTKRKDECYIALMGPLWGLGTSVILASIYFTTKIDFFGGAAAWVALVNVFNLLPINPLDGGRVFKSVVMSINGWFGLITMGFMVVGCIFLAFATGMALFGFLAFVGLLEFLIERWRIIKVQKKYDEAEKLRWNFSSLEELIKGWTDDKVVHLFTNTHNGILNVPIEKLHLFTAERIRMELRSQVEQAEKDIEKYKKDLPPLKLTYIEMAKWGILYIILTAVLWGLMGFLSSIPGVEIATQMMAS